MKAWVTFLSVLVAALGVFAWQWNANKGGREAGSERILHGTTESRDALCVDELMQNVDRHPGIVWVDGVVSQISAANQTLAVIDVEEFQQCGTTECARLILPVRWAGAMPVVQDTVRLEGEVQNSGGKLIFVARKLEKIKPKPGETK
jgi:hypothetical protein